MAKSNSWLLSAFVLFSALATALEVSPNSPCASKCLDNPNEGDPANMTHSLTFGRDVTCFDSDYNDASGTQVGKKFKECQDCMQGSGYEHAETGERDIGWFLFNNKATVDWCIFGRFAEESNDKISDTYTYQECNSACQNIFNSIDYRVKSDPRGYDFCDNDGNFTDRAEKCTECLYKAEKLTILGNILAVTAEMCVQKPGKSFNFTASVYGPTRIQVSSSENSTTTTPPPSSSASTSNSPSSSPEPASSSSGLSRGALAGIVLGGLVAVALLLGVALFFLRRARQRKEAKLVPHGTDMHGNDAPEAYYSYDAMRPGTKDNYYSTQQPPVELGGHSQINEMPASTRY